MKRKNVIKAAGTRTQFFLRNQFSFTVNNRNLACFLSGLADNDVSITGYVQTKTGNSNRVRAVVSQPTVQRVRDLRVTREVLQQLGIAYNEKKIIQARGPFSGIPGVIRSFNNGLYCKMSVNNSYIGEDTFIYLDVPTRKISQTLRMLRSNPIPQCPTDCP